MEIQIYVRVIQIDKNLFFLTDTRHVVFFNFRLKDFSFDYQESESHKQSLHMYLTV